MPHLVPARNSRHRFACLALYRALLRAARDVHVSVEAPEDIRSPVRWLIRGQFRRNRHDVSPRLVYAGLSAGYKFLDLFDKAKISGSPEHASVTEHVQSRLHGLEAWRARQPPPPPPKAPLPPPLLVRVPPKTSDPDEPPVFTSNILPRPKSAFTGPRKIPRLCATAFGIPFLRLKKPQPERLSKRLLSLNSWAQERTEQVVEVREEMIPEAALEDRWEERMQALARRELRGRELSREERELVRGDGEVTYWRCLNDVKREMQRELTNFTNENVARAKAMLEIVKKEEALAREEALEEARGAADDATR